MTHFFGALLDRVTPANIGASASNAQLHAGLLVAAFIIGVVHAGAWAIDELAHGLYLSAGLHVASAVAHIIGLADFRARRLLRGSMWWMVCATSISLAAHFIAGIHAVLVLSPWVVFVALCGMVADRPREVLVPTVVSLGGVLVALSLVDVPAPGVSPVALVVPMVLGMWLMMQVVTAYRERNEQRERAVFRALAKSHDELREAARAAEEKARDKDAFLATVSHELRTPLNGLLGMAELLQEQVEDEVALAELAYVRSGGEALRVAVETLLEVVRAESGSPREVLPFDLHATLERAAGLGRRALLGGTVQLDVARDVMRVAAGDAVRIGVIARQLVVLAGQGAGGGTVLRVMRGPDDGVVMSAQRGGGAAGPVAGRAARVGLSVLTHLVPLSGGAVRVSIDRLDVQLPLLPGPDMGISTGRELRPG